VVRLCVQVPICNSTSECDFDKSVRFGYGLRGEVCVCLWARVCEMVDVLPKVWLSKYSCFGAGLRATVRAGHGPRLDT
jgi:hypothetical protein